MEQSLTRDQARALFSKAGLTYAAVTGQSIQRLRALVNARMTASGLIEDTYRCMQRGKVFQLNGKFHYATLRCRSHYFEDREVVTFNPDGFIGFAGWAADDNVQPILAGFSDWVSETATALS